jgi:hypothetical protein
MLLNEAFTSTSQSKSIDAEQSQKAHTWLSIAIS